MQRYGLASEGLVRQPRHPVDCILQAPGVTPLVNAASVRVKARQHIKNETQRPDWPAGVAGFELAHLDQRRPFEASKEFPAISMNQGIRDFRLSLAN